MITLEVFNIPAEQYGTVSMPNWDGAWTRQSLRDSLFLTITDQCLLHREEALLESVSGKQPLFFAICTAFP